MEEGIEERLLPDDDEDDNELQSVPVHISFDLKDKPKELLNTLEKIKVVQCIHIGICTALVFNFLFTQKLQINFKNIKIGPCESIKTDRAEASPVRKFRLGPCAALDRQQVIISMRKVYIECENDLTETQKEEISKLKISTVDTLKVFCVAEAQEYKKGVFQYIDQ